MIYKIDGEEKSAGTKRQNYNNEGKYQGGIADGKRNGYGIFCIIL